MECIFGGIPTHQQKERIAESVIEFRIEEKNG